MSSSLTRASVIFQPNLTKQSNSLDSGYLLDDITHTNKEKYPNQNIFIILIQIKDYIYLVPYVENWRKKKAISIRVGENDIYELKKTHLIFKPLML